MFWILGLIIYLIRFQDSVPLKMRPRWRGLELCCGRTQQYKDMDHLPYQPMVLGLGSVLAFALDV